MATTELCKQVKQVEVKSDGNLFWDLFVNSPQTLPGVSPTYMYHVYTGKGECGKVGSVVEFYYMTNGWKDNKAKAIITFIDEKKKLVSYKFIEGIDILQVYGTFIATVQMDTDGEKNLVTWTFEYEFPWKGLEGYVDFIDFWIRLTKDIDNSFSK